MSFLPGTTCLACDDPAHSLHYPYCSTDCLEQDRVRVGNACYGDPLPRHNLFSWLGPRSPREDKR